jgi:hypothetical protein
VSDKVEFIGGPWAGQITMPLKDLVNGQCVEPQAALDAWGHVIIPSAGYRFEDGAFYWIGLFKMVPSTEKCPACKGSGRAWKLRLQKPQ